MALISNAMVVVHEPWKEGDFELLKMLPGRAYPQGSYNNTPQWLSMYWLLHQHCLLVGLLNVCGRVSGSGILISSLDTISFKAEQVVMLLLALQFSCR
ncbi:hypothetical protein EVAR_77374_1 [Eumeta japonica]|uniref:Uncharacterized protein n=1 Tax=Eumeta variegata TaxID=151549 RepID=A0A4C1UXS4_EUMVA|nr:hypothetical protein EVAR_77374_1 [Eumeta japonica]